MTALMDDRKLRTLSDEGLATLLREVQRILNRRPLTKASTNPDDSRALCLQDILTGAADDAFPPDIFVSSDGLKASYRLSQRYAEEFWRRFVIDYVPTLNKRQKWLAPQRNLGIKLIGLKVVVRCRYLLNPSAILCFVSNYFVRNFVHVIPQRFIL